MIIRRLTLENWRNFASVDVELGERVFIVGPNASGKSNLLDAIRFLRDLARDGGGGLKGAVDARAGGFKALRSLHARAQTDIVLGVSIGEAADEPISWRYELRMNAVDGHPTVISERIVQGPNDTVVLDRPKADEDDEQRRTTVLTNPSETKLFRPLVHFLRSIEYSHLVPQIIRERRGRPDEIGRDPYGADLLTEIAETPLSEQKQRLQVVDRALSAVLPQFDKLRLVPDKRGLPHLNVGYKHWRGINAAQNEEQFSDGTLRLIGMLWSLTGEGGPLLLEEPELSLHAGAVRQIPQMLVRATARSGRQVVLTTHSEQILSDEGIDPSEILLLKPSNEATEVQPASREELLRVLAERGAPIAKEVIALTQAPDASQLSLKFD